MAPTRGKLIRVPNGRLLVRLAATLVTAAALTMPAPGAAHDPVGSVADAVCGLSSGVAPGIGAVSCELRALEVVYVTDFKPASGPTIHRQTFSAIAAPTPLNVDNRPGADLSATVRPGAGGKVILDIRRLPGASATLPVMVAANLNDPDNAGLRYVFGYDTRSSSAPASFVETLSPRADGLGIDVASSGAASLALIGKRIERIPLTSHWLGAVAARIGFTPLPTSVHADVSTADDAGATATAAKLALNSASRVDVDFAKSEGQHHLDLVGALNRVKGRVRLGLTQSPVTGAQPPGERRTKLDLGTDGWRIASATATLSELQGTTLVNKTGAALEGLPTSATLTLTPKTSTAPQTIEFASAQPFGLIDVATANGEPVRLADDRYAYVFDDGSLRSAAARVRGLEDATLELGEDVHVDAKLAAGPFHVLVDQPGNRVDAAINDLPDDVDFTLRPSGTPTIHYRGSNPIGSVVATVHNDGGLATSEKTGLVAKDLKAIVEGLPTELDVTLAGRDIDVTANPTAIGKVEVLLSSAGLGLGSADQAFVNGLGTTQDGALVRDLASRFVIFARLASLRTTSIELADDRFHVELAHAARRFHALVEDEKTAADVDIQNLPATVDFTLEPKQSPTDPDPTTVDYLGSSTITKLTAMLHNDDGFATSPKTGLVADDLVATVDGLPTELSLSAGEERIDVAAKPTPVDRVELFLSSYGPFLDSAEQSFADNLSQTDRDGALVRDLSDRYITFARIAKLRKLNLFLEGQDRFAIDLTHDARRFHALVEEEDALGAEDKSLDVAIDKLPGSVFFAYAPGAIPTVQYSGGDKIDQVVVRRHEDDADGVAKSEKTGLVARDLRLQIDDLPAGTVNANLDPSGKNVNLNSSAAIGRLEAQLWTRPPGATSDQLPNSSDRAFVDGLSVSPFGDPLQRDGALVRDLKGLANPADDRYVVFARLSGLKSANLKLDDKSPDVTLVTTSRRDLALEIANKKAGAAAEEISGLVTNRPLCMRFALSNQRVSPSACSSGIGTINLPTPGSNPDPTVIFYEGSETTGGIELSARGLADLQGQELLVRMNGIPRRLEAIVHGKDRMDLGVLGGDGDVDLVEVTLRSGNVNPADTLATTLDGLLVRDKLDPATFASDRKVIFVRLSNLRSAHAYLKPTLDVAVDSVANRDFKLDVENDEQVTILNNPAVATKYVRATLAQLKPQTTFTMSDLTGAQDINYTSNGQAAGLTLDTNVTGSVNLHAQTGQLPTSLRLCIFAARQSVGGGPPCGLTGFPGINLIPVATLVLEAAQPVTVTNFLDCQVPGCGQRIELNNFRFQTARFQLTKPNKDDTLIFLDTDNLGLSGDLDIFLPFQTGNPLDIKLNEVHARFPAVSPALSAQDRRVLLQSVNQAFWQGSIFCPPGTDIFLTVNGGTNFNLGITDAICKNVSPGTP